MILIADSGSTKTQWNVIDRGQLVCEVFTKGLNPYFQTPEEMGEELRSALQPHIPEGPYAAVRFFGAGCTPEKIRSMEHVLVHNLSVGGIVEVGSDMLGAARSTCGREAGIACILGTGSNSCFYDGKAITANVSPLGFILGDEGSGAVLGRLLVGLLLKNQLGEELKERFLSEYGLTPADIIERVYRQPFPNRFLASFSPFITRHLDDPRMRQLVRGAFKDFFARNVMQYDGYTDHPVHFVGSVAYHYQPLLRDTAEGLGLRVGSIAQSPMEGLRAYYSSNYL